ncbi:MAG: hypothetical protein ABJB66_02865 [Gemmatimonadaceae bacterium]
MSITNWSKQRIVALWIVGGMLEFVIVFGPVTLVRYMATHNQQVIQAIKVQEDRYKLADSVNKASMAAQRDTGQATITASGEKRYPIVSDATPRFIDAISNDRKRTIGFFAIAFMLGVIGFIPVSLIVITLKWRNARRVSTEHLRMNVADA